MEEEIRKREADLRELETLRGLMIRRSELGMDMVQALINNRQRTAEDLGLALCNLAYHGILTPEIANALIDAGHGEIPARYLGKALRHITNHDDPDDLDDSYNSYDSYDSYDLDDQVLAIIYRLIEAGQGRIPQEDLGRTLYNIANHGTLTLEITKALITATGERGMPAEDLEDVLSDAAYRGNLDLEVIQTLVRAGAGRISSEVLGDVLCCVAKYEDLTLEVIQTLVRAGAGRIPSKDYGNALWDVVDHANPNPEIVRILLIGAGEITSEYAAALLQNAISHYLPNMKVIGALVSSRNLRLEDFESAVRFILNKHPIRSIDILTEIAKNVQDSERAAIVATATKEALALPLRRNLMRNVGIYRENQGRAAELLQVLRHRFLRRPTVEFNEALPARARVQNPKALPPNALQIAGNGHERVAERPQQPAPAQLRVAGARPAERSEPQEAPAQAAANTRLANALTELQQAVEQGIRPRQAYKREDFRNKGVTPICPL